jgi:DNA-binding transcriptional ArsR family regulator
MSSIENQRISNFFNALSHPVRVEIISELLEGKKCVSDIKELVDVNQPNVSQHLSVLKGGGIVDWHQEGKRKCYFLKNPRLLKDILKTLRK